VLICDRDQKWSAPLRHMLEESRVRVVQTPVQAPNCNAYAERFVRSIKEECLHCVIPMGERHFRRAIHEFVEHYHRERNHQGLDNELIDGHSSPEAPAGFADVSDSAACSTTITARRDGSRPRPL
jgi:transposase InsO family protein